MDFIFEPELEAEEAAGLVNELIQILW
jgi:hypothetical protein